MRFLRTRARSVGGRWPPDKPLIQALRDLIMREQHRVKRLVKPVIFKDEACLRSVRFGTARRVQMYLNRRVDLQREFGLYESELHPVYRRYVKDLTVVYDVGAADGLTSLTFARLARAGHVYAFEPADAAVLALERNLEANPSLRPRVTIVPRAVGDEGDAQLDAFIDRSSRSVPEFVKIDVDGGELDVLKGMDRLVRDSFPTILIEVHSRELEESCRQWLAERNYSVRIIRNAWWRTFYPELRPVDHNRWILAVGASSALPCS